MKKITCILSVLILILISLRAKSIDVNVKSPDGNIMYRLFTENNDLRYSVSYLNKPVILNSPIVFSLDGKTITNGVAITKVNSSYEKNETYPMQGVHSVARDWFKGQRIALQVMGSNFNYEIDIRAFNDGIGFRMILPGSNSQMRVPNEMTVFNLPQSTTTWYHDLNMHYESVHEKKLIQDIIEGTWMAPPVTFKLPQGIYASITESALLKYPGMALQSNGNSGVVMRLADQQPTSYPYKLRYSPEDTLRLKQPALIKGTIQTPWRVIVIGKDLNDLVNNDIISNLNPPPDTALFPNGNQTDWIRPGRAVWKYLDGGGDGTVDVMKHFTDGAAALGFEHNILEGFWSRWTDDQMRDLVQYSKNKGVSIWFWKHSKSLRTPASRDSFFKKCYDLGVHGVKLDFFDHEAKEVVDLYEDIFKEAARYKLLLDFHGANKPTGLSRTYPNELTREAVKGMESSKLTDRATHETTVPFTRQIAGPAEYTVMHFGARRANTTWAHQIASAAIFSSPLLTYAAHPDSILDNPAVDIIKNIPPVWDETIVLPGSSIGELAIFARRKGNTWFLAIMNGTTPKKIRVPLDFLKSGNYSTRIAKDVEGNVATVTIDEKVYSSNSFIELDMVSGGGYIAEFRK